jgi:hypothetical protein
MENAVRGRLLACVSLLALGIAVVSLWKSTAGTEKEPFRASPAAPPEPPSGDTASQARVLERLESLSSDIEVLRQRIGRLETESREVAQDPLAAALPPSEVEFQRRYGPAILRMLQEDRERLADEELVNVAKRFAVGRSHMYALNAAVTQELERIVLEYLRAKVRFEAGYPVLPRPGTPERETYVQERRSIDSSLFPLLERLLEHSGDAALNIKSMVHEIHQLRARD